MFPRNWTHPTVPYVLPLLLSGGDKVLFFTLQEEGVLFRVGGAVLLLYA